jgi:hypothetical protein
VFTGIPAGVAAGVAGGAVGRGVGRGVGISVGGIGVGVGVTYRAVVTWPLRQVGRTSSVAASIATAVTSLNFMARGSYRAEG